MANLVVAGDYQDWNVIYTFGKLYFMKGLKKELITKSMVAKWEVVQNVNQNSFWKSMAGAHVGSMFFGSAGAFIGANAANRQDDYLVSIEFISGKRSLLQIEYKLYMTFIKYFY